MYPTTKIRAAFIASAVAVACGVVLVTRGEEWFHAPPLMPSVAKKKQSGPASETKSSSKVTRSEAAEASENKVYQAPPAVPANKGLVEVCSFDAADEKRAHQVSPSVVLDKEQESSVYRGPSSARSLACINLENTPPPMGLIEICTFVSNPPQDECCTSKVPPSEEKSAASRSVSSEESGTSGSRNSSPLPQKPTALSEEPPVHSEKPSTSVSFRKDTTLSPPEPSKIEKLEDIPQSSVASSSQAANHLQADNSPVENCSRVSEQSHKDTWKSTGPSDRNGSDKSSSHGKIRRRQNKHIQCPKSSSNGNGTNDRVETEQGANSKGSEHSQSSESAGVQNVEGSETIQSVANTADSQQNSPIRESRRRRQRRRRNAARQEGPISESTVEVEGTAESVSTATAGRPKVYHARRRARKKDRGSSSK